jgi:hypothetical protein
VPYRLPELIRAIAQRRTIAIVEGEKDVDNLRKVGIAATCNAGGAGRWRLELSSHFCGADVVLIPDNDDAGRDHVNKVGHALTNTADRIRILYLPNLPEKGDVSDWFAAGHTTEELLELILQARPWQHRAPFRPPERSQEQARATAKRISGEQNDRTERATPNADRPTRAQVTPDKLPTIKVAGGGLSDEATLGEAAIVRAGHPVYRRGAMLVRPVIEEVDATRGRRTKVAQLIRIDLHYLIDLLCKSAKWTRFDKRQENTVTINPPAAIAHVILNRLGEWTFDSVAGVITTPTLRLDGSLLTNPGYDADTRMILVGPPPMPNVPAQPTRDEALAALSLLDGLLDEFPFADEASRSVGLSCIITPVVRAAFRVAPMHAARAPTPGSGKSYLFDTAAAIAIGTPCPVIAAGRDEEETEKRLGAALLAGQPIINIDNINGDLGGDALCQIVERPIVEIRILGKSERVRIEARSTLFATGNNLRLLGDMTRRVLLATLDARQERPELRHFRHDPVAEVLADRGRYVAAALTVVRAYIVAKRPSVAPPLASFTEWSNTVRSALIWLGRSDPVETMEAARRDDPTLQAMEAVFTVLTHAIGFGEQNARTVAQIVDLASETTTDFQERYSGLKEALRNVAGDRSGMIDHRELGKWLSRHKGRVAKGVRLEGQADNHGHAVRWWLTSCG